jgi:tripartite-type tricarboxylate transporter receptor subunit TctC
LYFALLAPRATPSSIVERLNVETRKVLQQPDVQSAMVRQGLDPAPTTSAELAKRIRQETEMWASLVKKTGIRVE